MLFAQMFCVFVWMTTMGFLPYWQCKQNKTRKKKYLHTTLTIFLQKKKKNHIFFSKCHRIKQSDMKGKDRSYYLFIPLVPEKLLPKCCPDHFQKYIFNFPYTMPYCDFSWHTALSLSLYKVNAALCVIQ